MAAPTTIDEALDELIANADFEEVRSAAKASAFATAATVYLLLAPASQSDKGSSMALSVAQIEGRLRRAEQYAAAAYAAANGGQVRFFSAGEGFRR